MKKKIIITGGAGFIGCNIAKRFLRYGAEVIILDNLSRKGTDKNLEWLRSIKGGRLHFIKADISHTDALEQIFIDRKFGDIDIVFHMAAQVAVTTSVDNPSIDFRTNALGTFNLLEAIRRSNQRPILINASTNKVYGKLSDVKIKRASIRYKFENLPYGVSEKMSLDFYSPYGCSKGCAEQYVIDYSRIYGLPTVSFRQSCIYGRRQFGIEEQGWVAHFIISSIFDKDITIFGDGRQVRDILYIDDLIDVFLSAIRRIRYSFGKVYNIGGGIRNSISLLELINLIEKFTKKKIRLRYEDWRPGDQRVYISDIRKARRELSWKPRVSIKDGIKKLLLWVKNNKGLFDGI